MRRSGLLLECEPLAADGLAALRRYIGDQLEFKGTVLPNVAATARLFFATRSVRAAPMNAVRYFSIV